MTTPQSSAPQPAPYMSNATFPWVNESANFNKQRVSLADNVSADIFLRNELAFNIKKLYLPLYSTTYQRDILSVAGPGLETLTTNITHANFSVMGSLTPTSINVTANGVTAGPVIQVENRQMAFPTLPFQLTMQWTEQALIESAAAQRPITQQQLDGQQMILQLARDQYAYLGMIDYKNPFPEQPVKPYGLLNAPFAYSEQPISETFSSMITGNSGDQTAVTMKIVQILTNVQAQVAKRGGLAIVPNCLLLPFSVYTMLSSQVVSSAGNVSILEYLQENNVYTRNTGEKIEIHYVKWLDNQTLNQAESLDNVPKTQAEQKATSPDWLGNGGLMRAVWYYKHPDYCMIPTLNIKQTPPVPINGVWQVWGFTKLCHILLPYPETIGYVDGI